VCGYGIAFWLPSFFSRSFDLTLPLSQVADGYAAMDERRAIKVLLHP
jgi:hypothetical protein